MSQGMAMHGLYALRSGDLEKATSLFERLRQAAPEDFGYADKNDFVATTQTALASAKGADDEAIQHIEGMSGARDSCEKRYYYAMVFYQNERYDELAEELRSFVPTECTDSPILNIAKAKYVIAMASIHAAEGRTEQAKSLLAQYIEIWSDPDDGLPLVLRANKLRAELGLTGD
jgi:tetratricopeptide (TPR) repeat protein